MAGRGIKLDYIDEAVLTLALARPNVLEYLKQNGFSPPCKVNIEIEIRNGKDIAWTLPTQKEEETMPYLKEGSVGKKKRKDGRYKGLYKDEYGKWKAVYGYTRAECAWNVIKAIDERDERVKSGDTKIPKHTLFSLLDLWVANEIIPNIRQGKKREKGKISQQYAHDQQMVIKNHIKVIYPDKVLDKLAVWELDDCSEKVPTSRNRENVDSIINRLLRWAYKKGFMKNNLADRIDKHRHSREVGIPFSRKDQERILEYAKQHSKYFFHFLVYFWTGCRPHELRMIRHCDFDFFKGRIFIDGTKTDLSSRFVPLFAPLLEYSRKVIDSTSQELVFTCATETLRKELKRILVALGIATEQEISDDDSDEKKYTLKSTRHSFSTRMKEDGADSQTRMKWLGHSNEQMTEHYTHVLDEYEQQQADKINALYTA